jgi:hypothetical protein
MEMLSLSRRSDEAEHFAEWLSDTDHPLAKHAVNDLDRAVSEQIYGPVVASNLEYFRTKRIDPELAGRSAEVLSRLMRRSAAMYLRDSDHTRGVPFTTYASPEFKASLRQMQEHMTQGEIALLPEAYAMTVAEGRIQVGAADQMLSEAGSTIGRILADTNYSLYFSNRTMASAAELSDISINDVVETEQQEKMPHVIRTNLAIGQFVGRIAAQRSENLTIMDHGSGTGLTLASTIQAIGETADYDNLNIFGIESNTDFFVHLEDFALDAMVKIQKQNPRFKLLYEKADQSTDTFYLINQDLVEAVENIGVLPNGNQDVAVTTANYVWHRLPTHVKERFVERIDFSTANSIFLIADLVQNGSQVNRRYFNFGNNGPLNCGNIGLIDTFIARGYKVRQLGQDVAPQAIHPKLIEKISAEAENDGHFIIAYKGEEAERLVEAA